MKRDKSPETFGDRLEMALKMRRVRKITALAAEIGVNESTVSRSRRDGPISVENVIRLCEVLEVTTDWMLTGRGPINRRAFPHEDVSLMGPLYSLDPATAAKLATALFGLAHFCASSRRS